jgi:periplasmic divalent cation tolerance protein
MIDESANALVVLITTSTRAEAVRIAEILVGERLSACVQIMPEMESIYRWEGTVQREAEFLLIAKTTNDRFVQLEAAIRALNSYENPEIIALPVLKGSQAYLDWLAENVAPSDPESATRPEE